LSLFALSILLDILVTQTAKYEHWWRFSGLTPTELHSTSKGSG